MLFRPGWAVQVALGQLGLIAAAIALNYAGAKVGASKPLPWLETFLFTTGFYLLGAPIGWLFVTLWLRSRPNINSTIKNAFFVWGVFLLLLFAVLFIWGFAYPVGSAWMNRIDQISGDLSAD